MKQEGNNLQSNITADNVQETNLYVNSDIKQELDSFYDEYPEYETKVKQDNVENAVIVKTENVTISREAATVYNICSEKESHYLKKLYENHEIKDELVIGPTVVQAETVYIDNEHSLYTRTEPKDVIHNKISNAVHKSMQQVKVVISDKIYFCDICRKVFTSYNTIASHMSVHYSKKPCSYQVCKKNREMDSQIKGGVHCTGKKSYICDVCKKCFYLRSVLVTHMHIHTSEKPYTCAKCKKSFSLKKYLNQHMTFHIDEKPYICNVCKKCYKTTTSLNLHMRIHTGEKPYTCKICKKSFIARKYLNQHIYRYSHDKEKPNYCEVSKKCYKSTSSLNLHMHIKTGDRPSCEICNKSFFSKTDLKRHMFVHTGEKNYPCELCVKSYSRRSILNRHMRTHTRTKKPNSYDYSCDICEKKFVTVSVLKAHILIHTGKKPYICDVCKKCFGTKSVLQTHIRTHTGEKPYSCKICKKRFSTNRLNRHMRIHDNNK